MSWKWRFSNNISYLFERPESRCFKSHLVFSLGDGTGSHWPNLKQIKAKNKIEYMFLSCSLIGCSHSSDIKRGKNLLYMRFRCLMACLFLRAINTKQCSLFHKPTKINNTYEKQCNLILNVNYSSWMWWNLSICKQIRIKNCVMFVLNQSVYQVGHITSRLKNINRSISTKKTTDKFIRSNQKIISLSLTKRNA
jgi:hypothetical protein